MALWPLGLLIGLLIKFSDPGPVFYRQTPIGQFGRPFDPTAVLLAGAPSFSRGGATPAPVPRCNAEIPAGKSPPARQIDPRATDSATPASQPASP